MWHTHKGKKYPVQEGPKGGQYIEPTKGKRIYLSSQHMNGAHTTNSHKKSQASRTVDRKTAAKPREAIVTLQLLRAIQDTDKKVKYAPRTVSKRLEEILRGIFIFWDVKRIIHRPGSSQIDLVLQPNKSAFADHPRPLSTSSDLVAAIRSDIEDAPEDTWMEGDIELDDSSSLDIEILKIAVPGNGTKKKVPEAPKKKTVTSAGTRKDSKTTLFIHGPASRQREITLPSLHATVGEVKVLAHQEFPNIPPAYQRLIYAGKPLDDDSRSLKEYGIPNTGTLHLIFRAGGSKQRKKRA